MNVQPLVSVVVPTYNYGRYVGETIQSILGQSYPNLQIIVINDGSTDDTLDVLQSFTEDGRLIVHTQPNQGCTNATNNGFKLAQGNYFAVWGSDDVWNRHHIRLLVDGLQRHTGAGLAFDNAEYFYNDSASSSCAPSAESRALTYGRCRCPPRPRRSRDPGRSDRSRPAPWPRRSRPGRGSRRVPASPPGRPCPRSPPG